MKVVMMVDMMVVWTVVTMVDEKVGTLVVVMVGLRAV